MDDVEDLLNIFMKAKCQSTNTNQSQKNHAVGIAKNNSDYI